MRVTGDTPLVVIPVAAVVAVLPAHTLFVQLARFFADVNAVDHGTHYRRAVQRPKARHETVKHGVGDSDVVLNDGEELVLRLVLKVRPRGVDGGFQVHGLGRAPQDGDVERDGFGGEVGLGEREHKGTWVSDT